MDQITQQLLMGAASGGAAPAPATDPNFKQVALLLHGDGTNGAQNNTFVDSSTNNFSITRNGNATQGTFSPFSLPAGQWSNFFDGNGDYLSVGNVGSLSGDFTVECWVYFNSSGQVNKNFYVGRPVSTGTGGVSFGTFSTADRLQFGASGIAYDVSSTNTIPIRQWVHVAATRSGSTLRLFINGVNDGSVTQTRTYLADVATIGGNVSATNQSFDGYISNMRVVSGTALYTSNFTPPTAPLTAVSGTTLLACQDNRFRDNSSNNFTLTRNGDVRVTAFSPFAPTSAYSPSVNGGSGYFDGTGDSLTFPTNSAFAFPSDFTVECWFYSSTFTGEQTLLDLRGSGGTVGFLCFVRADRFPSVFKEGSGTLLTSTAAVNVSSWNHIAFVRSGSTFTIYVNGVSGGSVSDSTSWQAPSSTGRIGTNIGNSNGINGYISNVRVVKGTAVYTSNFTPPTAPLTAITNTSLLLNFTNAGIVDSAGKNVIETVGNAQISTSVTKFGTGSMYFDGSGDWLVSQNPNAVPVGRATFTIEGWINFGSSANKKCIAAWGTASTNQLVSFVVNAAGNGLDLGFWFNDLSTGNIGLTQNTWYHVVAQYDGTTRRIFVDGVQVATNTTTALNVPVGTQIIRVGANGTGAPEAFIGYIDDLRITNGVARYTASGFTPPSAPYPDL